MGFRFDIITDCWEEVPDLRPPFEHLKVRIKKLKDGDEVFNSSFLKIKGE